MFTHRVARSKVSLRGALIARSYTTSVRLATSDHAYIPLTLSCALSGSCLPALTVSIALLSARMTSALFSL